MNALHRYGRFFLLASMLFLFGVMFGCLQPADIENGAEKNIKQPRQVLIIRHGEKPDDGTDIHLTSRGAARAAALPSLFEIPPTFPTKPAAFARPDFLYATKASKHSNRPVETVMPLAKALGDMTIQQKDDFPAVVEEIFSDAKYTGKTVLICWHHGNSAALAHAIAGKARNSGKLKADVPVHWDGARFDRVWLFTFDATGNATFADRPQQLLFGDSKK